MEAPQLFDGLEFYFSAFFDLTGDRSGGFGPGPIPYSSIMGYAHEHGMSEEEAEDLLYHVREMDKEFLAYNQEENKRR